ncbi:hypothetical protein [Salibacterium aidingense]|nr:hypothetical protein [Salibacterium aidingense]
MAADRESYKQIADREDVVIMIRTILMVIGLVVVISAILNLAF